jgi:hypothetical protein
MDCVKDDMRIKGLSMEMTSDRRDPTSGIGDNDNDDIEIDPDPIIIIISLLMSQLLGHRPSLWITHKENGP